MSEASLSVAFTPIAHVSENEARIIHFLVNTVLERTASLRCDGYTNQVIDQLLRRSKRVATRLKHEALGEGGHCLASGRRRLAAAWT